MDANKKQVYVTRIKAENFQRIIFAEAEFSAEGGVTPILGKNASGKSCFLRAATAVLAGKRQIPDNPVYDDKNRAVIEMDLDNGLTLQRVIYRDGGGEMTVMKDGIPHRDQQNFLNEIIGKMALDPFAFSRLNGVDRRKALLGSVKLDVDLDALNEQEKQYRKDREALHPVKTKAKGAFESAEYYPELEGKTEVTSVAAAEEYNEAVGYNTTIETAALNVQNLTATIETLEAKLAKAKDDLEVQTEIASRDPKDVAAIKAKMEKADDLNKKIRANAKRRELREEYDSLYLRYESFTEYIDDILTQKSEALERAEMPLPALTIGDDDVIYNGMPYGSLAASEQLITACHIVAAAQPELRFLVVEEGVLLDDDNRQILNDFAVEADYRIILEVVGEDEPFGIVFREGEISAVRKPAESSSSAGDDSGALDVETDFDEEVVE